MWVKFIRNESELAINNNDTKSYVFIDTEQMSNIPNRYGEVNKYWSDLPQATKWVHFILEKLFEPSLEALKHSLLQ